MDRSCRGFNDQGPLWSEFFKIRFLSLASLQLLAGPLFIFIHLPATPAHFTNREFPLLNSFVKEQILTFFRVSFKMICKLFFLPEVVHTFELRHVIVCVSFMNYRHNTEEFFLCKCSLLWGYYFIWMKSTICIICILQRLAFCKWTTKNLFTITHTGCCKRCSYTSLLFLHRACLTSHCL